MYHFVIGCLFLLLGINDAFESRLLAESFLIMSFIAFMFYIIEQKKKMKRNMLKESEKAYFEKVSKPKQIVGYVTKNEKSFIPFLSDHRVYLIKNEQEKLVLLTEREDLMDKLEECEKKEEKVAITYDKNFIITVKKAQ